VARLLDSNPNESYYDCQDDNGRSPPSPTKRSDWRLHQEERRLLPRRWPREGTRQSSQCATFASRAVRRSRGGGLPRSSREFRCKTRS